MCEHVHHTREHAKSLHALWCDNKAQFSVRKRLYNEKIQLVADKKKPCMYVYKTQCSVRNRLFKVQREYVSAYLTTKPSARYQESV